MTERLFAPREQADTPPASHIPPYEAWRPEAAETYLNEDGTLKINARTREYEFAQLETPLIDRDSYPIVDIPAMVSLGMSLFRPGYRFPGVAYTKNGIIAVKDNIDHAQHDEIFYHPDNHDGRKEPERFRDSHERKLRMPWLFHNAKTHLFASPPVPSLDVMIRHEQSTRLTSELLVAAIETIKAGRSFPIRAESIRSGRQNPSDEEDTYGKQFLSSRHKAYYERYLRIRESLENLPEDTPYTHLQETLADSKPIDTIRTLGGIATHKPWNYSPLIRGQTSHSPLSKKPHINTTIAPELRITNKERA